MGRFWEAPGSLEDRAGDQRELFWLMEEMARPGQTFRTRLWRFRNFPRTAS